MAGSNLQAEIDYLLERCRLILDAIEAHEPEPVLQMRPILEAAAQSGNVRGMRTMRRDLLEMSLTLPPDDREALRVALARQESNDPINRSR